MPVRSKPLDSIEARTRFQRMTCALVTWVALSACAGEVSGGPEPQLEAEVGVVSLPVSGGSSVTRVGVVSLRVPGGGCTGILLNRFSILTAAHCFKALGLNGGSSTLLDIGAVYKQPDGTSVCLTRGPTHQSGDEPRCSTHSPYEVSIYPGYVQGTFDASRDLAVLRSVHAFTGVFPSDYAVIDASPIDEDGRLEFYGYGGNVHAGTGGGVLRVGAGEVDAVNPHHVNLVGGGARTCMGDSGGPSTIYFDQTSPHLHVVGVLAVHQFVNNNSCASSGGLERFSYIAPKMGFITSKIGHDCPQWINPHSGRTARRCFEPPVAFWSRANGLYVQAQDAGQGPLIANADGIGLWESFERFHQFGYMGFVSLANHMLVSADNGGASALIANRTEFGVWETFTPYQHNLDGWQGIALLSDANNNYVMADDAGASPLIARTSWDPGHWEQFFFETVP